MMLSGCGGGFGALGCIAPGAAIAASAPPFSGGCIAASFAAGAMSWAMLLSERFRFGALASSAGGDGLASDGGIFAAASRACWISN